MIVFAYYEIFINLHGSITSLMFLSFLSLFLPFLIFFFFFFFNFLKQNSHVGVLPWVKNFGTREQTFKKDQVQILQELKRMEGKFIITFIHNKLLLLNIVLVLTDVY